MTGPNPLQRRFEEDRPMFGADVRTFSPSVIELVGDLGFDYAWLDFEHSGPSPFDSHAIESFCRTAEAADVELVVRLPTAEPKLIGRVLDAGVRAIVLPCVETATEVETAVRSARYGTETTSGSRGVGPGRSNRWGYSVDDELDAVNDRVLVGAMIETAAAVENLESILSVPDLGFVFVGPGDLSLSLLGRVDRSALEVTTAIETAVDAARAADVPVGRSATTNDGAAAALERGYNMLTLGRDIKTIHEVYQERLDSVRSSAGSAR